jgi:hypothetical protein
MNAPMGWQTVPQIAKRDGHYTPNTDEKWCMVESRRIVRNRLICTECGAKWALAK